MKVLNVEVNVETGVLDRIVYTLEHDGVIYYRVVKHYKSSSKVSTTCAVFLFLKISFYIYHI